MAWDMIEFQEELSNDVLKVIRTGLNSKIKISKKTRKVLEKWCKELEDWNSLSKKEKDKIVNAELTIQILPKGLKAMGLQ